MWDGRIDVERDTKVFQVALCIYVQLQDRIAPKDLSNMPPSGSLDVQAVEATDEDHYPDKHSRNTPKGFLEVSYPAGLSEKDLADALTSLLQQKVLSHTNALKCGTRALDLKILEIREFDSDTFSTLDGVSFLTSTDIDALVQWFFEVKVNQVQLKTYLSKYLELWSTNQFNDYSLNILDSTKQIQLVKDQIIEASETSASDTQVLQSPEIGKNAYLDLFATAWFLENGGLIQIVEILSADSLRIKCLKTDKGITSDNPFPSYLNLSFDFTKQEFWHQDRPEEKFPFRIIANNKKSHYWSFTKLLEHKGEWMSFESLRDPSQPPEVKSVKELRNYFIKNLVSKLNIPSKCFELSPNEQEMRLLHDSEVY